VEELVFVIVVAAGAFAVRLLATRSGDAKAAELRLWQRVARLLGGELLDDVAAGEHALVIDVDGARLVVRTRSERVGRDVHRFTVAHASPLAGGAHLRIEVVPRGIAAKLARPVLASGEAATGDETFDGAFRVTGTPKALAIALLDHRLRRALLDTREGFLIEHGELRLEREGVPEEPEPVVAMARHAQRVIRAWSELTGGPHHLARELGWVEDERGPLSPTKDSRIAHGVRRSIVCDLVVRFRDEWALSVVCLRLDAPSEPWSIVRDGEGWTEHGTVPQSLRDAASLAPRALVGMQRTADALELAFDGLHPPPTSVTTALDAVIDAVDAPALAPYR
jgi:hypothetical protein